MLCDCGKQAKRKVNGICMCFDCLRDYNKIEGYKQSEDKKC